MWNIQITENTRAVWNHEGKQTNLYVKLWLKWGFFMYFNVLRYWHNVLWKDAALNFNHECNQFNKIAPT